MKLLEGKNAIITGASRGIGKGIAQVFTDHGANVAFTYSSSEKPALELEKELKAKERQRPRPIKAMPPDFEAGRYTGCKGFKGFWRTIDVLDQQCRALPRTIF